MVGSFIHTEFTDVVKLLVFLMAPLGAGGLALGTPLAAALLGGGLLVGIPLLLGLPVAGLLVGLPMLIGLPLIAVALMVGVVGVPLAGIAGLILPQLGQMLGEGG